MDFDWEKSPTKALGSLKAQDVEESFEDPFAVRLLPDSVQFAEKARYFNLGRSANGEGVFSIYRTNGRQIQVIHARTFYAEERFFYERQQDKLLNQKTTT
ncbi:MAG: hypothetical protein H8E27_03215 [Verrucomicrobia subdivision 3 bacterium]|nr:hypothetical protein [Limisphaerales bacterium]